MTLIGETLVQFGGKIGAHNLQKFGAEFRSALGKLSHVLQIPFCKPCGPPRHDVHWTNKATIRTRIPDKLPGTEHYHGFATENRFSFAGNEANRVRNPVTPFDDYLARREVDPGARLNIFRNSRLPRLGSDRATRGVAASTAPFGRAVRPTFERLRSRITSASSPGDLRHHAIVAACAVRCRGLSITH
jgi:hypothetical protein